MKRFAIINDVHGNAEALKVALRTIEKLDVNYIIFTGDLIGIGPSSNEVLEIVSNLKNRICIRGNHENYYSYGFDNNYSSIEGKHHDWIREQIDEKYAQFINKLPNTMELYFEGFKLHITHYARRGYEYKKIVHNLTPIGLDYLFSGIRADIVIYGHEHQKEIEQSEKIYINVGSLGCNNLHPKYATFGILNLDNKTYYLDLYNITYDLSSELNKIDNSEMPQKERIRRIFFVDQD